MKKTKFILGALACSLLLVSSAWGVDATGTLNVQANVQGSCTVETSTMSFTHTIGEESESTANITVDCTPALNYDITLDQGKNFSGSRHMRLGETDNLLAYELYQPDGTTVWGEDGAYGATFTAADPGITETYNVTGVISATAGEAMSGGAFIGGSQFTDSIAVTVTY